MTTELPTEHELINGARYRDKHGCQFRVFEGKLESLSGNTYCFDNPTKVHPLYRVGPVAVYRPEPAEPKGIGAVIRAGDTPMICVRNYADSDDEAPWRRATGRWYSWSELPRPIIILSDGHRLIPSERDPS